MRATFLRAALMRVCQPGPVERKCASTSASSRNLIACFGFAMRGRPRRSRTSTPVAGRMTLPPTESWPRLTMVAVKRGPSSRSIQGCFEDGDLFGIALPHRDYAPATGAGCPNDVDQTAAQVPVGGIARFAVIEPAILNRQFAPTEDDASVIEIQAALLKRLGALSRIIGNLHEFIVPPENMLVKGRKTIGGTL